MLYLGIDTTNKYLIITLFNDDDVLYFHQEVTHRNVSEKINVEIDKGFKFIKKNIHDLDGIVVTRGPGSFTGVRIGLSVAKVLAMILDIDLYSVSSMQYFSGNSSRPVVLDARSNKVFYGLYNQGEIISEQLVSIDDIVVNESLIGDLSLFNQEDNYGSLRDNFRILKNQWREESYLEAKPEYLKENL